MKDLRFRAVFNEFDWIQHSVPLRYNPVHLQASLQSLVGPEAAQRGHKGFAGHVNAPR
jgi:hypothetical protein